MLKPAGLADYVDFIEGDALASLAELPGTFDFVLIDPWKDLYIPCLDRLHPKLAAGGMILADNMIFPPENEETAQATRPRARRTHETRVGREGESTGKTGGVPENK